MITEKFHFESNINTQEEHASSESLMQGLGLVCGRDPTSFRDRHEKPPSLGPNSHSVSPGWEGQISVLWHVCYILTSCPLDQRHRGRRERRKRNNKTKRRSENKCVPCCCSGELRREEGSREGQVAKRCLQTVAEDQLFCHEVTVECTITAITKAGPRSRHLDPGLSHNLSLPRTIISTRLLKSPIPISPICDFQV